MKKKAFITVTIGVIAYNEEANIQNLLRSVLSQKIDDFLLKEIVVVSDASTDETVNKVRALKSKKIKLLVSEKRIGKSQELSILFRRIHTDVLVTFDADVILVNTTTLSSLVQPFLSEKNVGLVSGLNLPIPGKSFVEKAIHVGFHAYDEIGIKYQNGNNPHTCSGCILAFSKEFISTLHMPKGLFADDTYLYFACIKNGFKYKFSVEAKVWFKSATTLRDHISQNTRFVSMDPIIKQKFGKILKEKYRTPLALKYSILLKYFFKKPFHSIFILLINLYCNKIVLFKKMQTDGIWKQANSTKKGIIYAK